MGMNIDELTDRMIMDVRLGIQRSPFEIKQLLKDYNLTSWDMPWVLDMFKEKASKLTDANLLHKGDLRSSDEFIDSATKEYQKSNVKVEHRHIRCDLQEYDGSFDLESEMISTITRSITRGLLSDEDLRKTAERKSRGDRLAICAIVGIILVIFIAAFCGVR